MRFLNLKTHIFRKYFFIVFLLSSQNIGAAPVEYEISGVVTSVSGVYSSFAGENVTASFIYDTAWTALTNSLYRASNNSYGIYVEIGGVQFDSRTNSNSQFNHLIDIIDNRPTSDPLFDEFNYVANPELFADDLRFVIDLLSSPSSLDALTSSDLPESLDLAKFDGHAYGEIYSYDSSGFQNGIIQYEIVSMVLVPVIDTDGDGYDDASDNCLLIANVDLRDTDGDGYGNRCDADFDQNCVVNFIDLNIIAAFFLVPGDFDTDLNGDGVTNFLDFNVVASSFLSSPEPSGVTSNCDGN